MNLPLQARQQKISPKLRSRLGQAIHYREFLQIYFNETGLSYAEVARRAGFSSRSYPRDVTEGRRRLTAKSLPTLLRGLRLDDELAKVVQLLYFSEYPEENPESLPLSAIETSLAKQRLAVLRPLRGPLRKKLTLPKPANPNDSDISAFAGGLTDVIAALGSCEEGVTLEEIHARTGMPKTVLAGKLEALVSEKVVNYQGDSRRYKPGCEHLDWTGEVGSHLAREMFRSSVERLNLVAKEHFSNKETLFLTSAFSVSKSDLPQLKAELKELILKFVDRTVEAERTEETVVQIVTGLFEGRLALPNRG